VVLTTGITSLCMIPIWTWIAHRIGKRKTWLIATAIGASGLLALYSVGITTFERFVLHMFVIQLGMSAFGMLFWSMLPDTVEYGQWKTGIRSEAIVFGFTTFAQKVSIGIAGWILGFLLTWTGYESNAAQSQETLDGILMIMTLIPTALILLASTLVWRYPIETELHDEIVRAIDAGEVAKG